MGFVNTRAELGERATLDGLIDGTLEVLRENFSYTYAPEKGSYHNFPVKSLVTPNASSTGYLITQNSSNPSTAYRGNIETIVCRSPYNAASLFIYNRTIKTVDLVSVGQRNDSDTYTQVTTNYFTYFTSLRTLILRNRYLVNIGSTATGSSIDSGGAGAEVYVPQSLLASYQAATNWAAYDAYGTITWKTIEGSEYHHHYADGSPLPHTVTYSLIYCSSSNTDTETWYGDPYETTITVASGHINPIITVTMQESVYDSSTETYSTVTNDITSTVYNSETGVISIPSVTGNISITATAT